MTTPESKRPTEEIVVEAVSSSAEDENRTSQPRRILYRHPTDRRLGGVCGGMGEYFDVDPVLIRLLWIMVTIASGGLAILAYLMLWLVLPVGTASGGQVEGPALPAQEYNVSRLAWVLIGAGIVWLLANTGLLPRLWEGFWMVMGVLFWPAVLILAGVALLRKHGSQGHRVDLREHLPDGARVKEGLNSARRHIPIKRPRRDRMLLGVCAGLAHALDIDPAIVRILFALFSLGSLGTGVILYVILAILMPEEKPGEAIEVVEAEVL